MIETTNATVYSEVVNDPHVLYYDPVEQIAVFKDTRKDFTDPRITHSMAAVRVLNVMFTYSPRSKQFILRKNRYGTGEASKIRFKLEQMFKNPCKEDAVMISLQGGVFRFNEIK